MSSRRTVGAARVGIVAAGAGLAVSRARRAASSTSASRRSIAVAESDHPGDARLGHRARDPLVGHHDKPVLVSADTGRPDRRQRAGRHPRAASAAGGAARVRRDGCGPGAGCARAADAVLDDIRARGARRRGRDRGPGGPAPAALEPRPREPTGPDATAEDRRFGRDPARYGAAPARGTEPAATSSGQAVVAVGSLVVGGHRTRAGAEPGGGRGARRSKLRLPIKARPSTPRVPRSASTASRPG